MIAQRPTATELARLPRAKSRLRRESKTNNDGSPAKPGVTWAKAEAVANNVVDGAKQPSAHERCSASMTHPPSLVQYPYEPARQRGSQFDCVLGSPRAVLRRGRTARVAVGPRRIVGWLCLGCGRWWELGRSSARPLATGAHQ